MAYDEDLAARVRALLRTRNDVTEQRMFGGLAFMVSGHMCCGVLADRLMVRVGPAAYEAALARPCVSEMNFTGRPLRGMVYVEAPGLATAAELSTWVRQASDFVSTLPPKRPDRSGR